ncbi:MAG: DsbC family protein [Gammaproteobacteria bacterium]
MNRQGALTLALALVAFCAVSLPARADDDPVAAGVLAKLKAARADLEYGTPRESSIKGLYEVGVRGGPTLYVSADGAFFVAGDLFSIGPGGFTNLAEKRRSAERRDEIAALRPEDIIVFAPPNPKATIAVFTDIDCGYCRKLHQEVPELNRLGIAVHYLAFPRAGIGSPSYRKLVTAYCAEDRGDALTRLKRGENLPDRQCDNPVESQYMLGQRIGVEGTPALVLEDGTLIPGYQPAADLARLLGIN